MESNEKLGLSAFSTKKAENEPWLIQSAFVSPPDFEFQKGDHSTIIFGESGTGKTATCHALEQYSVLHSNRLLVHWRPILGDPETGPSTPVALKQLHNMLCACANEFCRKLSKEPSLLLSAGLPTQEYLIWFIKCFTDYHDLFQFLPKSLSKREKEYFNKLTNHFLDDPLREKDDLITIAIEFSKAIEMIGFDGIWIIVDNVEWVTDEQRKSIVNSLSSILSTLKLFDIPYLSFKMALPMELEADLANALAITRDRAMVFRLTWDISHLTAIIERRLAATLNDTMTLNDIYSVEQIQSWLEVCGGSTPRGWLEYFRPIISSYWSIFLSGKPRRLTKEEWRDARKRSSLYLQFDPETNQVRVGMGAVKTLSAEVGAIFTYLYNNQGRYCTKRELYRNAYVPFANVKEDSEKLTFPKEYDDLINTAIYRLRQIIEPNPKDKEPVFITTKRDVGIKLSTQAFQQ